MSLFSIVVALLGVCLFSPHAAKARPASSMRAKNQKKVDAMIGSVMHNVLKKGYILYTPQGDLVTLKNFPNTDLFSYDEEVLLNRGFKIVRPDGTNVRLETVSDAFHKSNFHKFSLSASVLNLLQNGYHIYLNNGQQVSLRNEDKINAENENIKYGLFLLLSNNYKIREQDGTPVPFVRDQGFSTPKWTLQNA